MILGLDISTSCVGFCVIDSKGDVQYIDHAQIKGIKNIFAKAKHIRDRLVEISVMFNIEKVAIEEPLKAFQAGKSSATVLSLLLKFNGMTSYICSEIWGFDPEFVHVSTARKGAGICIRNAKKCGITAKEQAFIWTREHMKPKIEWEQRTITKGKNKGKKEFLSWCYDRSDAFVVAYSQREQKF